MKDKEFIDRFMEINVDLLDYISQIVVNGSMCIRNGKDYDKVADEIMSVLTEIINLKLDYEDGE